MEGGVKAYQEALAEIEYLGNTHYLYTNRYNDKNTTSTQLVNWTFGHTIFEKYFKEFGGVNMDDFKKNPDNYHDERRKIRDNYLEQMKRDLFYQIFYDDLLDNKYEIYNIRYFSPFAITDNLNLNDNNKQILIEYLKFKFTDFKRIQELLQPVNLSRFKPKTYEEKIALIKRFGKEQDTIDDNLFNENIPVNNNVLKGHIEYNEDLRKKAFFNFCNKQTDILLNDLIALVKNKYGDNVKIDVDWG